MTRPRYKDYLLAVYCTFFDGITRHTEEGYGFAGRAAESGFRQAVRERDEPFGDFGLDQDR